MPSARITTASTPEPTSTQKGIVLACALLFIAGLVYASKLPPFLPDEFLLALAWKYSALLSIPLAYLLLDADREKRVPKGPHLVILPFVLYFGLAQFVLFVPDLLLGCTSGPGASRIVAVSQVRERSTGCGKQARVEVAGYSPVSFDLCVPQAFAQTLLAGDKLRLEGTAGLGGLRVLRQVKL